MAEAGGSEEVFEVLSQACSDDYEVMKAAEHRLLSWEGTSCIHTTPTLSVSSLLSVFNFLSHIMSTQ
jgi:hypothetical protein